MACFSTRGRDWSSESLLHVKWYVSMESVLVASKARDLRIVRIRVLDTSEIVLYIAKGSRKCVLTHVDELKAEFLRKLRKASTAPFFSVRGCLMLSDIPPEKIFDVTIGDPLIDDLPWRFDLSSPNTGSFALDHPGSARAPISLLQPHPKRQNAGVRQERRMKCTVRHGPQQCRTPPVVRHAVTNHRLLP